MLSSEPLITYEHGRMGVKAIMNLGRKDKPDSPSITYDTSSPDMASLPSDDEWHRWTDGKWNAEASYISPVQYKGVDVSWKRQALEDFSALLTDGLPVNWAADGTYKKCYK
jgi:hypothetical protein